VCLRLLFFSKAKRKSRKKKHHKKEEAADGHEHEEGERTQGNEAPGSQSISNSGRKQKRDSQVRPHSWAAALIVKHEVSFIINLTFVNHEANFIMNLNVCKSRGQLDPEPKRS
jgi:hypothetical protein